MQGDAEFSDFLPRREREGFLHPMPAGLDGHGVVTLETAGGVAAEAVFVVPPWATATMGIAIAMTMKIRTILLFIGSLELLGTWFWE